MKHNLLIVESPAKAKTIKKFLGNGYDVIASNGHVRDLPKSTIGVDVNNDFEPKYITIRGKGDLIAELKKAVKKADMVYLATDPDREGEAISWHLAELLKLEPKKFRRVTFNEITKNAIQNAMKQARDIDMELVDAQQARRVLDRLVGYQISPVLWAKVKSGLSAGRVQSVALKIIADRENEINSFVEEEYWHIDAELSGKKASEKFTARLTGKSGESNGKGKKSDTKGSDIENGNSKFLLRSKEDVDKVYDEIKNAKFTISEIKNGERRRKAPLPFTTSTLQQEASKLLGFSPAKTMQVAQQLYEGVDVEGHGTIGLITYLRTDSTRISDEADKAVRSYINEKFGKKYEGAAITVKNSSKKIQDAHEAIRPSYVEIDPAQLKASLSRDQLRLYKLIWQRFVASRMEQAVYDTISVKLDAAGYCFSSSSSKLKFDGFMSVYKTEEDTATGEEDQKAENNKDLSWLNEKTVLKCDDIKSEQHFTQPPAHFNEGSLVKALEELGIGRPSTYAPTISTIVSRHYVAKENKNLYMTELGEAVNGIMCEAFPEIVDVNFTATMENLLDGIEEGDIQWKNVIRNFYPDLEKAVAAANKDLEKVKIRDEVSDIICENCGRNMVIKYGPHGKFLACPGFPECRNTKPLLEKSGQKCPKCKEGDVLIMKTKKGRRFYGCSNHPECDFVSWQKPADEK
ncbi:MAG: type I DNA topoisomerase [Lachnospiraceae bacterium]|nr:type I DNA topoisomerase [Lachnospiraceae bacterium]